jgi:hypothetical protein
MEYCLDDHRGEVGVGADFFRVGMKPVGVGIHAIARSLS